MPRAASCSWDFAGAGPPALLIFIQAKTEVTMRKLLALYLLLAIGALGGCNTMQGMGKDIERGGEKLQDSSKETRERM
jgi:predicted small secreted protein